MKWCKLIFPILLLFVSGRINSQTYGPKFKCDCPDNYSHCAAAFDSVDWHKNFRYMLCSGPEFTQQGVILYSKFFMIKLPFQNHILFKGIDSMHYAVWSKRDKFYIALQVMMYSFHESTKKNTVCRPQNIVTYTLDTLGKLDSVFSFKFPKRTSAETKEIVTQYRSSLNEVKRNERSLFNYTFELGNLVLAALNGDATAKQMLYNFDNECSRIEKKKLIFSGTWLQDAIYVLKKHDQFQLLK